MLRPVAVLLVLAAGQVSLGSAAAASTSAGFTWVYSPSSGYGEIAGSSCVGSSWCWSVGSLGRDLLFWNGRAWVAKKVLTTVQAGNGVNWSISCVSKSFCAAVGWPTGALIWHGASWSTVPMPRTTPAWPTSVSCVSSTFCMAVGTEDAGGGTISDRWDGTKWVAIATAVEGSLGDSLEAVACVSTTFCEAVGSYNLPYPPISPGDGPPPSAPLAEVWDGASWSIQTTPDLQGQDEVGVQGLSCSSQHRCVLVGEWWDDSCGCLGPPDSASPLAMAYDGTSWSQLDPPDYPVGSFGVDLAAVTCPTTSICVIVGEDDSSPIVLSLDGSTFRRLPSYTPKGYTGGIGDFVNAVACTAALRCVMGGVVGTTTFIEMNWAAPLAPAITSMTPSKGPSGGGTVVFIKGWYFTGTRSVTFGGKAVRQLRVLSSKELRVVAPAGRGAASVLVTTDDGASQPAAFDFR